MTGGAPAPMPATADQQRALDELRIIAAGGPNIEVLSTGPGPSGSVEVEVSLATAGAGPGHMANSLRPGSATGNGSCFAFPVTTRSGTRRPG